MYYSFRYIAGNCVEFKFLLLKCFFILNMLEVKSLISLSDFFINCIFLCFTC